MKKGSNATSGDARSNNGRNNKPTKKQRRSHINIAKSRRSTKETRSTLLLTQAERTQRRLTLQRDVQQFLDNGGTITKL